MLITAASRPLGAGGDVIVEAGRYAEELGYDTLWTGEAWGRDAVTVLTQVASHLRCGRSGLGSRISSAYLRAESEVVSRVGIEPTTY